MVIMFDDDGKRVAPVDIGRQPLLIHSQKGWLSGDRSMSTGDENEKDRGLGIRLLFSANTSGIPFVWNF